MGAEPAGDSLDEADPLVRAYAEAYDEVGRSPFFRLTVEELLSSESHGN